MTLIINDGGDEASLAPGQVLQELTAWPKNIGILEGGGGGGGEHPAPHPPL